MLRLFMIVVAAALVIVTVVYVRVHWKAVLVALSIMIVFGAIGLLIGTGWPIVFGVIGFLMALFLLRRTHEYLEPLDLADRTGLPWWRRFFLYSRNIAIVGVFLLSLVIAQMSVNYTSYKAAQKEGVPSGLTIKRFLMRGHLILRFLKLVDDSKKK